MNLLTLKEIQEDSVSELLRQYYTAKYRADNNTLLPAEELSGENEQNMKNMLSRLQDEAESDLSGDEKKVTEWLAALRLLKGIPLKYMVPLHHLLPNESIRFFSIDQQWIDHLIQGALSLGNNGTNTDKWHDEDRIQFLQKKSGIHLHNIQVKSVMPHIRGHFHADTRYHLLQRKLNALEEKYTPKAISGFIMRSDFVKKYAGVRVEAVDGHGGPCPCLSSEIIGGGIKLCLFDGALRKITFHENNDSLLYKVSDLTQDSDVDGRLNVLQLADRIGAKDSANFAKNMLSGPETFTFELIPN